MRDVTVGEPLLPRLTAPWYNNTLRKSRTTGLSPLNFTDHQNVLLGHNDTSSTINYLDPIGISSLNDESEKVHNNVILTEEVDEYNWAICHQKFFPGNIGPIAAGGITLANVEIKQDYHKYVNIEDDKCVSACYGKAQLLAANENGPSLIYLGVRTLAQGVAFTQSRVPARDGVQMGSVIANVVESDPDGILTITDEQIVLWNMQPEAANNGFVQWKEFCGLKVVDVSPCEVGSESFSESL